MIKSLKVRNLKGFKDYTINFSRLNLLVGGNNSGKTTVFHALQVLFWCIDQTADVADSKVSFKKTQVPELGAIPYFNAKDLFYNQKTRSGSSPTRIQISLRAEGISDLNFTIYPAFSRNIMIDGANQTITLQEYQNLLRLKPVYVPGTIGITVKEELYRTVAQERLILEGRQNQVLRNLVYRLRRQESWPDFERMVSPLFKLSGLDVPFDDGRDEWLTAVYKENGCEFDLISAGSGFLQVINLLSFLFLHTSTVALLDEPDSHMHDDLQKLTFDILDKLSRERNIQLIIATHSPTFIDAAGLDTVLLIDRNFEEPLKAQSIETLIPLLSNHGISLPPAKVINTLKTRKVLFVEGHESDYEEFIQRLGEVFEGGFRALTRGLTVFQTEGSGKKWPFDAIECFEKLIGVKIDYLVISDKDFLTDEQVKTREKQASDSGKCLFHLSRRNRESYLLEASVIARLIESKWKAKHAGENVPIQISEQGIKEFIIDYARTNETLTRTKFTLYQDQFLKLPMDQKSIATQAMHEYFHENYVDAVNKDAIPYKLLDAKEALAALRSHITQQAGISFADREILETFRPSEIPREIKQILQTLKKMFEQERPHLSAGPITQPLLKLEENKTT